MPNTVGRKLTEAERETVIEQNSPLIEYVYLSPNADFPRGDIIRKITIHHMAGDLTLEGLGETFAQQDRRASSNYAIDSQGRVGLYVEEANQAWTSRSPENDSQAVTIEVANDEIGGEWHVSDAAYERLIDLCVDICQRNEIQELLYTGDETGNLTLHSMFYSGTECPGPYLKSRMDKIAAEVNRRLDED
ncbi:MAG: N-acetylmuramoyl-L-alanine amidase [Lachnospiraceae bacterium]|nr:N-acetylmuramoyl-L-alanine amidase [Lachnospiraceae bacterium]